MKKLIFVKTGKEVEMGKTLAFGMNSAYGFMPFYTVVVCEESIPFLIEEGVIKEVEDEGTHVDPNFYLEHLAGRIHWNVDNLRKYLGNLYTIYPAAVFSILLRDKANNSVENLEWCDCLYNVNYGNGINKRSCSLSITKSKRVAKCNSNMEIIEEFNSVLEAKALTGINNSKIGECCNGKRRSAGGYKWKWL